MGCIRQIGDASDTISLPPKGHTVQFPTKVSSQFVHKMSDFWYPLSMTNEILCYNEGQPLLMKCFKTFLRYIMQLRDSSRGISLPLTGHSVPSQPTLTLKLHTKCQSCWYPLNMANGMICHKERQPLFMKCFRTILRCTRQMRGASHSMWVQLMGLIVPFPTDTNSQINQKYQILVPAQYGRWDDVLQEGATSIVYEVFQNQANVHKVDGRCF